MGVKILHMQAPVVLFHILFQKLHGRAENPDMRKILLILYVFPVHILLPLQILKIRVAADIPFPQVPFLPSHKLIG